MPIFEYLCDDCGNKFEKLVRRSAEAAAPVPILRARSCDHAGFELFRGAPMPVKAG